MDNDFFAVVASLVYNNREGIEATVGGGWNKYDGDHFGLVKWVKNVPQGLELLPDFEYYRDNAKKTDWNVYGKVNYELARGLNGFLDFQYRHIGIRMQNPGDWYGANADGEGTVDIKDFVFNGKPEGDVVLNADFDLDPKTSTTRLTANLMLDGKEFDASYYSYAVYELNKSYVTFTGTVCTGKSTGSGVFTISIYGDGELIHEISGVTNDNNNKSFNVDVTDVTD